MTLVLTQGDVRSLRDMERAVPAVEEAFAAHGRDQTQMPVKVYLDLPRYEGDFRAMPAYFDGSAGVKWVNSHPKNPEKHGLPAVLGMYILSDPDTAQPLAGIVVPQWDDILTMAARAFDVSKLGYVGVDLVLDKERGPLLLELNGRPGLSIQIANQFGLRAHLAEIEGLGAESKSAEVRAGLAKRLFARSFPNMRHRPPSPQTEAPAARDAERDVADAAQDRKVVRLFAEAS